MLEAFIEEVHWGNAKRTIRTSPSLAELGRSHWLRFHRGAKTPSELEDWEKNIAVFGCDCGTKYAKLKEANPVRWNDLDRWKWEIHNSVNLNLGKPEFSWAEFEEKYPAIH